jgi:hypothetical protein
VELYRVNVGQPVIVALGSEIVEVPTTALPMTNDDGSSGIDIVSVYVLEYS